MFNDRCLSLVWAKDHILRVKRPARSFEVNIDIVIEEDSRKCWQGQGQPSLYGCSRQWQLELEIISYAICDCQPSPVSPPPLTAL